MGSIVVIDGQRAVTEHLVVSTDDVMRMLDGLLEDRGGSWWDGFFSDRSKPVCFFVDRPDENLVEWCDRGLLTPGRVLELGAGAGRNAVYLARKGFHVDAVDFSATAVSWARERADAAGVDIRFQHSSLADLPFRESSYDLVYDSGCFHHIAPHRRRDYVELVRKALRPGGRLGLVCFRPDGGSGYTDRQVYERRGLGGGLGYSEDRLRALWERDPFTVSVFRRMRQPSEWELVFGESFLWTLLVTKQGTA